MNMGKLENKQFCKLSVVQSQSIKVMKLYENRRKYSKISYQKRLKLIDMVQKQNLGVTRAARKLRIKIPTAKVILSSYRKKGAVFVRKCQNNPQKEQIQVNQVKIQAKQSVEEVAEMDQNLVPVWLYPTIYYFPYQNHNWMINF